ncbi:cache domain-containing sensor histidine kinase [Paenibacillus paridis]|uniref:cache domain-containing sensor histidine kinase n=1 Tax=Paenibacillus paridis TaxID=2583376 RepID=UPI0011207B1E|nr:sensor histidine kinase [Paenibacillus paridis]
MKTLLGRFLLIDSRMKLRNKMLISFVLMVLIPSVCIGFFSYQKSSAIISEQTSHAYLEALRQTTINISYRLDEIENISEMVYANETLQKLLRKSQQEKLSVGEVIDDYKSIIEILENLEKNRNIFRIRLMIASNPMYAMEGINILSIEPRMLEEWNARLSTKKRSMEWVYSPGTTYPGIGVKETVSLYRTIKDFKNVRNLLGLVAIDVDQETINAVLRDMNLNLPYQAVLMNRQETIATYSQGMDGIPMDSDELHAALGEGSGERQSYTTVRMHGDRYLHLVQPMDDLDWQLVVLIPSLRITDQSSLLGLYILLLSVSLIAFGIGLSYLLSNRITSRLSHLIRKMKDLERGQFGKLVDVSGQDEIAVLQQSFNNMSIQIESLIGEVYAMTRKQQQEELKVLEGRINSHFLYNTLDTVKWMSLSSKAPEIARIVTNLSKFYRISLNKGHARLSVEKELEHVQAYVAIQETRFSGKLRYETKVDPAMLHKEIIKLILQPIVENAILHGINKSASKQGRIRVRGLLRKHAIVFYITDTGAGISAERISSLLQDGGAGYGVRNVHERLKLYFGEGSGVRIRSKEGQGTSVRLLLVLDTEMVQDL